MAEPSSEQGGSGSGLYAAAQGELDAAAERLGLDDAMHRVLRSPKRELTVSFPVTCDDGSVEVYTGYRVHHNVNRGPATGGVRYVSNLTLDQVRALAMLTSWKAALVRIPFGGAAGGVAVNPRRLSANEREALTRRYTTEIGPLIGPERDILAPDVNTGSQTMAWIMDTFSMQRGYTVPGVVSGKPMAVGGTRGRRSATSRGALRCITAGARRSGIALEGATVALQGFGRVGIALAEELAVAGARVVAIGDDREAVGNAGGIDIAGAVAWMRANDAVRGMPGAEPMSKRDLYELGCDIVVSAGREGEVTEEVAAAIRARLVAEAGNGATTPAADRVLAERGIPLIPDLLCTAGGMVVGYFEWVQDIQAFFWSEDEVRADLDRIMDAAFAEVAAMADAKGVTLRQAAYMVSVARVAEATTLRGLYP